MFKKIFFFAVLFTAFTGNVNAMRRGDEVSAGASDRSTDSVIATAVFRVFGLSETIHVDIKESTTLESLRNDLRRLFEMPADQEFKIALTSKECETIEELVAALSKKLSLIHLIMKR